MTKRCHLLLGVLALVLMPVLAFGGQESTKLRCPMIRIEPERQPDLNIPRAGHNVFFADGELTVTGGHTTGFVPTPTAEYFAGDEWHLLTMVYTHDNGMAVPMKSGRVLLCGGHSEPIGIGQTYLSEWYDPVTHTFTGFGSLAQKRSLPRGVETDSGCVVIVGNHYCHDAIEVFDGEKQFDIVKNVAKERVCPYLFRTSDGDVIVAGTFDVYDSPNGSTTADRLKGEPFSVPLFEQWKTVVCDFPYNGEACFIGDETKGDYSYLLTVINDDRQLAIAMERDVEFSLLPTDSPIPMEAFGESIEYNSRLVADRQARRAYVMGQNGHDRHFLLSIDYSKAPATLALYYTDPMANFSNGTPILTPDGNLLVVGGSNHIHDNFSPLATVWLLRTNGSTTAETAQTVTLWWLWMGSAAFILVVVAIIANRLMKRRRGTMTATAAQQPPAQYATSTTSSTAPTDDEALMARIDDLMARQQLFLNSELKLLDVAVQLGTNRNSVSFCINSQRGCSFSQYVSNLRIDYAKSLMRNSPNAKISEVWTKSGFTTESSFFRTFKALTGTTPSEWKQKSTDG